jgi:hypothetical protein
MTTRGSVALSLGDGAGNGGFEGGSVAANGNGGGVVRGGAATIGIAGIGGGIVARARRGPAIALGARMFLDVGTFPMTRQIPFCDTPPLMRRYARSRSAVSVRA